MRPSSRGLPPKGRAAAPRVSAIPQILQDYPRLESVIEEIWPKKAAPFLVKW